MENITLACLVLIIFYIWSSVTGRKLKARISRIRKIHGPEAKIGYMNKRGKKYNWRITIESATPKGQDWKITAWCHEKNEFLVFYASQMYEYVDLKRIMVIRNVPSYFTEKFGKKAYHN